MTADPSPHGPTPAGRRVLDQVRAALAAGDISPADLRAVLATRAPGHVGIGATQVLLALGAAVVTLGIGLIYATAFTGMADAAQLTTPFVVSVVLPFAAAVVLVIVAAAMCIRDEGGPNQGLSGWHVLLSLTVAAVTVGTAVGGPHPAHADGNGA